jgi:hypothetical protein
MVALLIKERLESALEVLLRATSIPHAGGRLGLDWSYRTRSHTSGRRRPMESIVDSAEQKECRNRRGNGRNTPDEVEMIPEMKGRRSSQVQR